MLSSPQALPIDVFLIAAFSSSSVNSCVGIGRVSLTMVTMFSLFSGRHAGCPSKFLKWSSQSFTLSEAFSPVGLLDSVFLQFDTSFMASHASLDFFWMWAEVISEIFVWINLLLFSSYDCFRSSSALLSPFLFCFVGLLAYVFWALQTIDLFLVTSLFSQGYSFLDLHFFGTTSSAAASCAVTMDW